MHTRNKGVALCALAASKYHCEKWVWLTINERCSGIRRASMSCFSTFCASHDLIRVRPGGSDMTQTKHDLIDSDDPTWFQCWFPLQWHITSTYNHWCNEWWIISAKSFTTENGRFKAPSNYPSLVIFDEFSGQVPDKVLLLLKSQLNLLCNCTTQLYRYINNFL